MAAAVELDVGKLEIISDGGLIHHQMLRLYQNIRLAFLGCNTPASLVSDILAQVDALIFEAFYRKSMADAQGDWSDAFRWFTDENYNGHTFGDFLAALLNDNGSGWGDFERPLDMLLEDELWWWLFLLSLLEK